ncbi:AAT-domain-containing protein [Sparassis latifolia]|uniref:Acyl-coenzyme A:6-aminopenicillanic-acid-acyltransferase 40 kDa form n=1 Tax=Sparassis crispa TaxID=139825 RepID=A0A401GF57_9APHY|nr:Acyl-coenzyme A:6-aminopenicillanic-acid-acyltransferase 40 kDa form [Sparassis crispa]GBE80816.1 Acyl-coenzyme A:6-aminopenicillanic-acid-acyltransferase 40 kDa form [Sparassis crispa]
MPRPTVPRVELSGSPYEIGLAHGRLLAPQIHSQLEIYRDIFLENCKFEWPKVLGLAAQYRSIIAALAPELLEEMRGIADGVGGTDVGLLDIVALNSRSEIALGLWDDGCTSLAWNMRGSGKQLLAQNWDWRTSVGENLALAHITQVGKPSIWMVIEPGIVGKIGFNSASVGVCLNAIRASPTSTSLLPIHLLLRIALEHDSVDSAIAAIERLGGAASSQHILIADANGGRGLELSPRGGVYLKEDRNGIIVHTNHFLENNLVDEPPWLSGSPMRLKRARSLCGNIMQDLGCEGLPQGVNPALLRDRVFSDSVNSPQAICCVPDIAKGGLARIATLFNIVMMFEPREKPCAEVVFGKPGSSEQSEVYELPW